MIRTWLKRGAKSLGYVGFFMTCFWLFAYWTFPYDRVRDRVVQEAAKQGYQLTILELSPSWFTGVTLDNVELQMPDKNDSNLPLTLVAEEITARVSLLPLIVGTRAVSVDMEFAGGSLEADVAMGSDSTEVSLDVDEVNLAQISLLRRYTQIPLAGLVSGTVDLDMPTDIEQASGKIDLHISGAELGNDKATIKIPRFGPLTIDRANLGDIAVVADIKDGAAEFTSLKADGTDLQLDGAGKVTLARPLGRSRMDMTLKIKIKDAYRKKSARIDSALELAKAQPAIKNAETPDGALQYRFVGSFAGRITPTPAGKARLGNAR